MTIDKNTKITLGTAISCIVALLARDVWIRDQINSLKAAVRQVITIEDAQNWTDEFRHNNPSIPVPNTFDVLRKRRPEAALSGPEYMGAKGNL